MRSGCHCRIPTAGRPGLHGSVSKYKQTIVSSFRLDLLNTVSVSSQSGLRLRTVLAAGSEIPGARGVAIHVTQSSADTARVTKQ